MMYDELFIFTGYWRTLINPQNIGAIQYKSDTIVSVIVSGKELVFEFPSADLANNEFARIRDAVNYHLTEPQ